MTQYNAIDTILVNISSKNTMYLSKNVNCNANILQPWTSNDICVACLLSIIMVYILQYSIVLNYQENILKSTNKKIYQALVGLNWQ